MSSRIQPECFIEVWKWNDGGVVARNNKPIHIEKLKRSLQIAFDSTTTIALFLIRLKTPQEQANSIYYPTALNQTK